MSLFKCVLVQKAKIITVLKKPYGYASLYWSAVLSKMYSICIESMEQGQKIVNVH